MKNRISIILTLCLLCAWLGGCGDGDFVSQVSSQEPNKGEKPNVTLCTDLHPGEGAYDGDVIQDFLDTVPGYNEEFTVTVERIPQEGTQRETAISRIRTEMASGAGPDVFFCVCGEDGLFQYPQALMERGGFLPLDSYISQAQYMEWDSLIPVLMEAGRAEQGQMLLPVSYRLTASLVEKEGCTLSETFPLTWDQALASQDPWVQSACWRLDCFDEVLGELADYSQDVLTFSEDELAARLEEASQATIAEEVRQEGAPLFLPDITISPSNVDMLSPKSPEYLMIPQYNTSGGVTASITGFVGINANARNPEAAFRLVDWLFSRESRENSEINIYFTGLPTDIELVQKEHTLRYIDNVSQRKKWYLGEWNYQQIRSLIGQINAVNFITPLNGEMNTLFQEYRAEDAPDKRQALIHKHYSTMQMMVAES